VQMLEGDDNDDVVVFVPHAPPITGENLLKNNQTLKWLAIHECKLRIVQHEQRHACNLCRGVVPYEFPTDPDHSELQLYPHEIYPEPVYYCADCDFDLCINCMLYLHPKIQPDMFVISQEESSQPAPADQPLLAPAPVAPAPTL
jgi:hypothetical protein